jgi:pentose-5-phosphate-3-epimerase
MHLMADRPAPLIAEFAAAGADLITIHAERGESEAGAAIEAVLGAGCSAGLALPLDIPLKPRGRVSTASKLCSSSGLKWE